MAARVYFHNYTQAVQKKNHLHVLVTQFTPPPSSAGHREHSRACRRTFGLMGQFEGPLGTGSTNTDSISFSLLTLYCPIKYLNATSPSSTFTVRLCTASRWSLKAKKYKEKETVKIEKE